MDYFIADLHFGDGKVANERDFDHSEDHDNYIIEQWNKTVEPMDTVYIVGDVTRGNKDEYKILDCLKGKKIVILGNWELKEDIPQLWNYVDSVCSSLEYENSILSHIPLERSCLDKLDFCIHGHLHSKVLPDKKYINVSCNLIGYTPRTFDWLTGSGKDNDKKINLELPPQPEPTSLIQWIKKTPDQ